MYGHHYRTLDRAAPGEAFAIVERGYGREVHLLRMGEPSGSTLHAVDAAGMAWTFAPPDAGRGWREGDHDMVVHRTNTAGNPYRVYGPLAWTDPLPRCSDARAAAWVGSFAGDRTDGPALLHVWSVDGDRATASLVTLTPGDAEREQGDPARPIRIRAASAPSDDGGGHGPTWTHAAHGAATFWEPALTIDAGDLAAGDLLIAGRLACEVRDGTPVIVPVSTVALGNFGDRDAVGAFVPDHAGTGLDAFDGPVGPDAAQDAIDLGHAALEPDELIAVVAPNGEGRQALHVLCTTGASLHRLDDPGSYLYGELDDPGLWVLEGARGWGRTDPHTGEHDCGIEGDWRPAVPADLARFGLDASDVADALERDAVTDADVEELCADAARFAAATRAARP